jgi:lipoate-protein ligase A
MALDHGMALAVPEGSWWLRFYRWTRPTVSLGRNQPAREIYDRTLADELGIDIVRRPTGGRAVLHDDELTYSLAVIPRPGLGPREIYARVNRALARGLRTLGAEVTVVSCDAGVVLPPDAGPCFRAPAPGELTAGGRKVVGSAQVRIEGTLLQHGSVLLDGRQDVLTRLGEPPSPGAMEPTTLRSLLGRVPGWSELVRALGTGFLEELGPGTDGADRPLDYFESDREPRPDLLERYTSDEWTWRR